MVRTLGKTIEIIETLEEREEAGTAALARETGLPRSTIHHHLSKLAEEGFVINQDGTYRLALRFFEIGEQVRQQIDVFEIAKWEVNELAEKIDSSVGLFVAENERAVLLYRTNEGPGIPVPMRSGRHLPLHATAAGKALLTTWDSVDDAPFEWGQLPSYTTQTITEHQELASDLETAKERGYAISKGEYWENLYSIAVPLSEAETSRSVAIEIAFTPEQFEETDIEEVVSEAKHTAKVIGIKSDYS